MWMIFKSKKQRIIALEDKITDKEARLNVLSDLLHNCNDISYYHIGKIEDLTAEISVLRKKLEREIRNQAI